ncbi:MAG: hypothetical protein PHE12_02190 [Clostridia bacterium]|nr:hypothetical protein [Clostridia bacterium]
MSKTKSKSSLKILAADAKARLKNGFYKNNEQGIQNYQNVTKCGTLGKRFTEEDKQFYDKVKAILEEGNVINPLTRLVDQEYIKTLDYNGRQRYLLEISEKFKYTKQQILEELQ